MFLHRRGCATEKLQRRSSNNAKLQANNTKVCIAVQFRAEPIGEFRGAANYYDGGYSKPGYAKRKLNSACYPREFGTFTSLPSERFSTRLPRLPSFFDLQLHYPRRQSSGRPLLTERNSSPLSLPPSSYNFSIKLGCYFNITDVKKNNMIAIVEHLSSDCVPTRRGGLKRAFKAREITVVIVLPSHHFVT